MLRLNTLVLGWVVLLLAFRYLTKLAVLITEHHEDICRIEIISKFHPQLCGGAMEDVIGGSYLCTDLIPKCLGDKAAKVPEHRIISTTLSTPLPTIFPGMGPLHTQYSAEDATSRRLRHQYEIFESLVRSADAIPIAMTSIREIISMTERMLVQAPASDTTESDRTTEFGGEKRIRRRLQEIQKTAYLSVNRLQAYSDRLDVSLDILISSLGTTVQDSQTSPLSLIHSAAQSLQTFETCVNVLLTYNAEALESILALKRQIEALPFNIHTMEQFSGQIDYFLT
ncbi:hypothetical protein C8J57DRAFT_1482120 [Mycena rebaudengoi]|nr:hypothetical protein C8J57DRAFT_1482120 [Mycena rebaudengoi]